MADNQMMKPLDGIRVWELSNNLAAAACGRILAYLGAEVTKVIPPGGDPLEKRGALYGMPVEKGDNPLYAMVNDGKKFMVLNMKTAEGQQLLKTQLACADVFLTDLHNPELEELDFPIKKSTP